MKLLFISVLLVVLFAYQKDLNAAGLTVQTNVGCTDLSPDARNTRLEHVKAQLALAAKQIADTDKAKGELNKSLKVDKAGNIIAKIGGAIAGVALAWLGLSAVKDWAAKSGIAIFATMFGGGGEALANVKAGGYFITIEGRKVYVRDPTEALAWIDSRIDDVEAAANVSPTGLVKTDMPFLHSACTGDYECPTDPQAVDELMKALAQWYAKAQAAKPADAEKRLSEIEIPFVEHTARILKLKLGYYKALDEVLKSCISR
ncbi:MAG: hypothetical protein HY075_07380 [Deltaproteobacteria bacterium]|nr:hypothetical protein [Deltaproteobacteria bacterium]